MDDLNGPNKQPSSPPNKITLDHTDVEAIKTLGKFEFSDFEFSTTERNGGYLAASVPSGRYALTEYLASQVGPTCDPNYPGAITHRIFGTFMGPPQILDLEPGDVVYLGEFRIVPAILCGNRRIDFYHFPALDDKLRSWLSTHHPTALPHVVSHPAFAAKWNHHGTPK